MTVALALAVKAPLRLVSWLFWTTLWVIGFAAWATVYWRERKAALSMDPDVADSLGPVLVVAGLANKLGLKTAGDG